MLKKFSCEGLLHFKNIRNKKLGEANQKVYAGGTLESPAGLCKATQCLARGQQGQWVSELPVIPRDRWQGWDWSPGVLTLKRTLWVMSQVREVQVTPPSHEADVV